MERRELPADAGDEAGVRDERLAGLALGFQHAGVVGHQGAGAVVPLGIGEAPRKAFVLGVLRREVQRQAQPRRGAAEVLRQRDVILVFGGLRRVVGVVVVGGAVEVQALRPGHDRLEAVDDEAVLAARLVLVLASGRLAGAGRQARDRRVVGVRRGGASGAPPLRGEAGSGPAHRSGSRAAPFWSEPRRVRGRRAARGRRPPPRPRRRAAPGGGAWRGHARPSRHAPGAALGTRRGRCGWRSPERRVRRHRPAAGRLARSGTVTAAASAASQK